MKMHLLLIVALFSCLLQGTLAAHGPKPTPPTRRVDEILKGFTPNAPPAIREVIPENFTPSANFTKRGDYPPYVHLATAFVEQMNPGIEFAISDGYYIDPEREAHVYFPQTHHGLNIANTAAKVGVASEDNKVFYATNNFYRGELPEDRPLDQMDFSSPLDGLRSLIALLQLRLFTDTAYAEPVPGRTQNFIIRGVRGLPEGATDARVKLVYYVHDGQLFLTWSVDLDVERDYFSAYVDARSPSRIITAWSNRIYLAASDAEFLVFPWGVMHPGEGDRVVVNNPWTLGKTSRTTWISNGHETFNTTQGNNVKAGGFDVNHELYHPVSATHNFSYPLKLNARRLVDNLDAAIVQAFYTANMYHDVLYKLGFDEEDNYQDDNDGRGGPFSREGDAVVMIIDDPDPACVNNAFFVPTVDGKPGSMRLCLADNIFPPRDIAFDAQSIIHEYTHGMTQRLVDSGSLLMETDLYKICTKTQLARGLGEGWSDFMALAMSVKDTQKRMFIFSEWQDPTLRTRPYSTDYLENDYTFASLGNLTIWESHYIGEVWATILHEVMWKLIDKYGLSVATFPDLDSRGYPTDGKFLAMKITIMSMRNIGCPMTFIGARDAFLNSALRYFYDTGHNALCDIWEAFAKRGMGWYASEGTDGTFVQNSFHMPMECNA